MKQRLLCIFLLVAGPALLAGQVARADVLIVTAEMLTPDRFPLAAESIRDHLLDGGAHAGLADHQKERVDTFLDRIQGYIDSGEPRHRPRIGQLQLRVNAILAPQVAGNHNTSEMICRREKPVGSHIPETVCYNRHDLEENARYIQHQLIQIPEMSDTR